MIKKLSKKNINAIIKCLGNNKISNVSNKDKEIIKKYFEKEWIGYGYFNKQNILVGYCFIKEPKIRPETMTVVRQDYRNIGIATLLRNYALEKREFIGHVVYSSVKNDNLASFKSILKSGFSVFDITKDGYIQLMKVLPYARRIRNI